MDYRYDNKYMLIIGTKFLEDNDLEKDILKEDIENYIRNFYLNNKPQSYSVKIGDGEFIKFHKIDVRTKTMSKQRGRRVITFFVLNYIEGINKIVPVFRFSTQEEKTYNQLLKTSKFAVILKEKFKKYINNKDVEILLDV